MPFSVFIFFYDEIRKLILRYHPGGWLYIQRNLLLSATVWERGQLKVRSSLLAVWHSLILRVHSTCFKLCNFHKINEIFPLVYNKENYHFRANLHYFLRLFFLNIPTWVNYLKSNKKYGK